MLLAAQTRGQMRREIFHNLFTIFGRLFVMSKENKQFGLEWRVLVIKQKKTHVLSRRLYPLQVLWDMRCDKWKSKIKHLFIMHIKQIKKMVFRGNIFGYLFRWDAVRLTMHWGRANMVGLPLKQRRLFSYCGALSPCASSAAYGVLEPHAALNLRNLPRRRKTMATTSV